MIKQISVFFLFVLFYLMILNLQVSAQDTTKTPINPLLEMTLEELINLDVEVASTKADNIFKIPSTVTVVSKEEIERYNFISVSELIQSLAGFSVERTYLKRNLPTGRGILQDHYANKVLILVNGIASWNAVTGEGNLDRINIEDIERIEVLKGPASVLYGTNAYSGTINIILKEEKDDSFSVHAGYGMNNSYEAGASVNLNKNDLNMFASIHSSKNIGEEIEFTDEDSATNKMTDFLESNNATFNLKYKSHTFLTNAFTGSESYYGVTDKFSSGAGNAHKLKGIFANYTFDHNFSKKINLKIGCTYDYVERNLSRLANDSIRSSIAGKRINTFAKINIDFSKLLSYEFGIDLDERFGEEYRNYIVKTDSTIADNNMTDLFMIEHSIFSQLKFNYKKILFLIGDRFTDNDLSVFNHSPRITLVYSINKTNSLKAIYGESYRSPSLFESYFYSETTVFGNKNLKPETAKSIEFAYLTSFKNLFIQALAYRAVYENKIVRTKDSTIVIENYQNINDFPNATVYGNGKSFNSYGIEFEAKYVKPKRINAFVNFDYTMNNRGDETEISIIRKYPNAENDTIKTSIYNFKFVPSFNFAMGVQKEIIKNLNTSIVFNYIGKRGAIKPDFIEAQKLIDINISYKHKIKNNEIIHSISCKNILNEELSIPEYSRLNNVNSIPFGIYRHIAYTLKIKIG